LKTFSSKDRHVLHAQGSNIIPTSQVVFQKLIFITCKLLQKGITFVGALIVLLA